jgi:hypothetical protein
MAVLKHIGPGSAFKVGLVVYGFIGLIVGVLFSLIALVGAPFARQASMPFGGAFVGLFAVILCPILYGIFGGIVAAISALIYNLASGWVGGLEVEIH